MYYLYILKCSDNTLYTGITIDLKRRVIEHNYSRLGAKYTKSRRPVKSVFSQRFRDRSRAAKAEAMVKKMTRSKKEEIIKNKEKIILK
jgi:putative endonuclease